MTTRRTDLPRSEAESPRDARARAVIVSDVRLYRDGLALALASRDELRLVATASDADAARAVVATHAPDVVLLDTGMPEALRLARELRDAGDDGGAPKVVAFAVADVGADVIACAEAGVSGYVPRDASVDDVVRAVRDAVRGELHCSPRAAASLFERLAALSSRRNDHDPARASADASQLTRREREIVVLIDEGLSNKEIGRRLRIGTATVKNHVHNILEKLRVRRRAEAAARLRPPRA